jgi:hypothetical protein
MRANNQNKSRGEKKQMKQGDLLLSKVQKHIARQTIAGAVLLLVGVMILNVNHFAQAGTTNNIVTNLNVTAGALELYNVDLTMNFSSADVGVASTENAVQDNIVVRDRSAGASLWTLYANATAMQGLSSNISAYNITVVPSVATLYNLGTFNNQSNAVGRGADGSTFAQSNNTALNVRLFNSIHNMAGNFAVNGIRYDITVGASLPAGVYNGSMTMTLMDDAP